MCARISTHTELSPNTVSWAANTDCAPYIRLSFFFLCKPNLLLERQTQTAMHLTRPSLHHTFSLLLSTVLYICTGGWPHHKSNIFMRKRIHEEKGTKEDFLAVHNWTCNSCSLIGNQELYLLTVVYSRHGPSLLLTKLPMADHQSFTPTLKHKNHSGVNISVHFWLFFNSRANLWSAFFPLMKAKKAASKKCVFCRSSESHFCIIKHLPIWEQKI